MIPSRPWHTLPAELKLSIVELLHINDLKHFSLADNLTHALCVPSKFQKIKLTSYDALASFLHSVPPSYHQHIRELHICTKQSESDLFNSQPTSSHPRTDAVASILASCIRLEKLSLALAGSLDKTIVPGFSQCHNLKQLSISNWGLESDMPISERLVVSIAATIPALEHLSLNRVSRSALHASELLGVYPYVPVVTGDEDIPSHPLLGSELRLPSLLRLPALRKLAIHDTHLGDPQWATTPVACRLEVLDLGSCAHEDEDANRACTERIMAAVGPSVGEFSLATPVSHAALPAPLPRLRKLHIAPFLPPDSVVDTISTFAGSPIERLSLQCFEDDVVDVCGALEDFLSLRVERGPEFYHHLTQIDVSVTAIDVDAQPCNSSMEDIKERAQAAKHLQDYCLDLRLATVVNDAHAQSLASAITMDEEAPALDSQRGSASEERCPVAVESAGNAKKLLISRPLPASMADGIQKSKIAAGHNSNPSHH